MSEKILVVDDEQSIRELVGFNLRKAGYDVLEAADGRECLQQARIVRPILIVLDLMLPGLDGLEVCRTLKGQPDTADIGIIMLTAKSDEVDKVVGLELGADDYLTKPFSPRELVARVKAILRRSHKEAIAGELTIGRLKLNFNRYEVSVAEEPVELTPKEFDLLKLLVTNSGRVFSREQLLDKIWGYEYYGDSRTVDVHIRHLRAKLAGAPEIMEAVETVRGIGYRFRDI